MRLCEVIFGLLTTQDVLDAVKEVAEKMGKTIIQADDKPGFIVNRALLPMLNEACVIVGSYIGSVEEMDNGMKLGCNHPMGPLELADMIGLDVLLNVMTVMEKEIGSKYALPAAAQAGGVRLPGPKERRRLLHLRERQKDRRKPGSDPLPEPGTVKNVFRAACGRPLLFSPKLL